MINHEQFGYNTSNYYYCKYLRNIFSITYVCWDQGLQKIGMDKIETIYVSRQGNFIFRSIRFIKAVLNELDAPKENVIIFIKYFKLMSVSLRLLKPRHTIVLDIRTGNISHEKVKRFIYDSLLQLESLLFKNITVISESLASKLKLSMKAHILPLGSNILSSSIKDFEDLNFLYVGSLYNRKIEDTIKGFKQFYDEYQHRIRMKYTIVGSGITGEEEKLRYLVEKYNLLKTVRIVGRIHHSQLTSYFNVHNIGVSYVPMKDYYDCQPVTKTYEYLLAGMPVIATNTSENNKVIDGENGVLVNDNPESFYKGLKTIFKNKKMYDSIEIRNRYANHTWEKIVSDNLRPYLETISPH